MTEDEKKAARARRRILKWGEQQGIVDIVRIGKSLITTHKDGRVRALSYRKLIAEGLVDENLNITPAGELEKHQLEQMKFLQDNYERGEDGKWRRKERKK